MRLPYRPRPFPFRAMIPLLTLLTIAAMAMTSVIAGAHTGHEPLPNADCASTRAYRGTPASVASPVPDEETAGLGTPVAVPCVTVTLEADGTTAGPRQLTVFLIDEDGAPVSDANVRFETQHLEMNHGTSIAEAMPTDPGHYMVKQVSMGMTGTWQVDVVVTRTGYEQVTATFLVELEGPA